MEEKLELNQLLITQAQLLSDATEVLDGLVKGFSGLFEDLTSYFTNKNKNDDQLTIEFEKESEKIKNYIIQVHTEIPALTKGKIY